MMQDKFNKLLIDILKKRFQNDKVLCYTMNRISEGDIL